jgi:hypothetical protein
MNLLINKHLLDVNQLHLHQRLYFKIQIILELIIVNYFYQQLEENK